MKSTGMINDRLNGSTSCRLVRYLCLTLLLFVALAAISVTPVQAANEGDNIAISVGVAPCPSVVPTPVPPYLLCDDQQNPSIIALSDKNKWFVVWEDWRNWSATGSDIYGRFIDENGDLCGAEIAICIATGNQTVPTVAYSTSGDGNILIAWQDSRGTAAGGYLYYNTLDTFTMTADCSATPATLGTESAVGYTPIGGDEWVPDEDTLISRKLPKAAYDTIRDQFWLVWIESRDALQRIEEQPFGVAAYMITPPAPASPTNLAITTKWNFGDSNYAGYVAISTVGVVIGTPEVIRNSGSIPADLTSDPVTDPITTDGIFDGVRDSTRTVRLISHSMSGTEDVYVYEYFKNLNNITVSCDDSSPETLIVWEGVRGRVTLTCTYEDDAGESPKNGYPDSNDIFSAELVLDDWDNDDGFVHIFGIFDKYITQTVVNSQKIDASTKSSFYPAVGFDTTHRKFLVAWEDRDPRNGAGDGIHSKIFGQLVYSGGGLYGLNLPISFQDTNSDGLQDPNILASNQTRPQISLDSTNQRFFVTWQDGRNSQISLENLDIYGQFLDSEGSLRGNNYAVCVEEANQYNPVTAYNSASHQFLAVWKDARNLNETNSDIYGQRLTLGQPQLVLLKSDGNQLIPPFINFNALEVGQSSTVTITMKNVGDSLISIDYVDTLQDPPFSYVNLPDELATAGDDSDPATKDTIDLIPGASYPLTVQFAPDATGVFIDEFTIYSDSTDLKVNLQGQALAEPPAPTVLISLDPSELPSFGNVNLQETAMLNLAFINGGNLIAKVTSYEITEGFSILGLDGGAEILPGKRLNTIIKFTPLQSRSYSGYLLVFFDDGSALTVNLSGVGIGSVIISLLTPGDVNFGNVAIGETRSANLTFLNTGNVDLSITSYDLSGTGFSVEGLPAVIPAGGRLDALAFFTPELAQAYNSVLRVLFDSGLGTPEINLSGVGVYDVNSIIEVPDEINFGSVNLGEVNSANLRFINRGGVPVSITAVDLPDGAFVVNGLPAVIPAYGVLDVLVTFSPLVAKAYLETMRVLYDHGIPTSYINFVGVGVNLSAPAVTLSSYSLDFGNVGLGSTRTANLILTNTGDVDVEITAFDLPSQYFIVSGLNTGTMAEGQSKVVTITFAPTTVAGDFGSTMVILFDHDIPPAEVTLAGMGVEIEITPEILTFPGSDIGSKTVLQITLTNNTDQNLQVKSALTGTDIFSYSGLYYGDIIHSGGGKLVFSVTFIPMEPGYIEDYLFLLIGSVQPLDTPMEEIDWGNPYWVTLVGLANADFSVTEPDTFTADINYDLTISASTNQPGQVFVLLSHDPFSTGAIYVLTQNGTLQPFPYASTFGWQSLWNINGTYPGNEIDLNSVDFRQLGCSQCQGQAADSSGSFYFGNILINVPNTDDFRSASDFKYMVGTLYMATYVKNSPGAGVFDFNQGLLEMQSLKINSLAGSWRVTSRYYDTDMVHAGLLVVTEPGNGQISAVWPPYNQTMVYSDDESAYVMTFNMGIYAYTYKITALTSDSFTGSYTCIANGEIVADNLPVSGVRVK